MIRAGAQPLPSGHEVLGLKLKIIGMCLNGKTRLGQHCPWASKACRRECGRLNSARTGITGELERMEPQEIYGGGRYVRGTEHGEFPSGRTGTQEMVQDPLDADCPGCQHQLMFQADVKGTVFTHSPCPCPVDNVNPCCVVFRWQQETLCTCSGQTDPFSRIFFIRAWLNLWVQGTWLDVPHV